MKSSVHEKLSVQGFVEIHENDNVIGQYNTIRSPMQTFVARALAGLSIDVPSYIGLGTGSVAQYARSNQGVDIALVTSGANERLAQEFIPSDDCTVSRVLLYMKRIGSSSATINVSIQTNNAGVPSGTVITNGTATGVAHNTLGTSYGWVAFSFPTPPTLTNGTTYHIVVSTTSYTYSAAVTEIIWGADQSSPGYTDGDGETYNGSAWSAVSPATDFCFRVVAAPDTQRTTLLDEIQRNVITSGSLTGTNTARLLALWAAADANDYISEIGLFDAAVSGNLLAVAAVNYEKVSPNRMSTYWIFTVGVGT